MKTLIHERVELAQKGLNQAVICRMESGWAVLADRQILKGYCLLLPDPVPADLNELPIKERGIFLRDVSIIGDVLLEVCGAAIINYEILGNTDRALHAHVIPRYAAEPDELRRGPVWFYDWSKAPVFDPVAHRDLSAKLREGILRRMASI